MDDRRFPKSAKRHAVFRQRKMRHRRERHHANCACVSARIPYGRVRVRRRINTTIDAPAGAEDKNDKQDHADAAAHAALYHRLAIVGSLTAKTVFVAPVSLELALHPDRRW